VLTPAEILDFYFANNFRLVYWPQIGDTKGPHVTGWTEKIYTREEYRDGSRVGIMCGHEISPGKFLHDVDIDWSAGSAIAQAILPTTDFMYGRASKKISHCWYTLPDALPSFKYEDPTDKGTLIELRGTRNDGVLGNQSMAPPSMWSKDGAKEQLAFVRMRMPTHVETDAIKRAVLLSAIAMLLAKHFGKQGYGHESRLAWAGFLLRAGVTPDECVMMGNAIMSYTGNNDKQDIRLVIDTTHKRLQQKDKKVKGGPALAKMMGEHGKAIIKAINGWLGRDSDFLRDSDGRIIKDHQENIARALSMLNIDLSYNEFSDKLLVNKTQALEDRQLNEMWFQIDDEYRFRPPADFFEKVIKRLCWQNSFHPVRDYFATLTWDSTPRIAEWLIRAGGAEDSEYTRTVSSIVLIAAVRRIKHPGCKYDEMLVLESKQGFEKSSALKALCPVPDWFTDDIQLNVTAQRMIETTLGKWIVEVAELSGMRQSLNEMLKANLSRQVDGPARMAYAHLPIERPRQFIFIGTTNSDNYLADPTGARRFWPIKVSRFDLNWIAQHRDQLWAEAVALEAAGASNRLPEHLWEIAGEHQEQRRELDPWENRIKNGLLLNDDLHSYPDGFTRVATSFLWDVVAVLSDRQSRREQMRISEIMQRLGFVRTRVRPHGEAVQVGYVSNVKNWPAKIRQHDDSADLITPHASKPAGEPDDEPY
jgi:predicted P-loop ATPase